MIRIRYVPGIILITDRRILIALMFVDKLTRSHRSDRGEAVPLTDAAVAIGSVTIGHFTTIAGQVAIRDHVTIGSHATIGGGSIVISNVESHQFVCGFPAAPHKTTLQQWASIKKLPDILKKLNLSSAQKK